MSESKKITITDFKCMICQEIMAFDKGNPSTFNSSTLIEEFFSMKLTRFSVSHFKNQEEHVNVIIVDQDGKYRGHKDGYINKDIETEVSQPYEILSDQLISHSTIDLFFVLNLKYRSIKEYVNSIHINTLNLVEKIESFIKENKELYKILPTELIFTFANKKFSLLMIDENTFCCITLSGNLNYSKSLFLKVFNLLKVIINGSENNSPSIKLIYIILKITDLPDFQERDLSYIKTMIESESFFSELQINPDYKEKILPYVKKFQEEFPCSNFVLDPMIAKKTTLIEIFEDKITQYRCIIDFIQYLNRRKLFIF